MCDRHNTEITYQYLVKTIKYYKKKVRKKPIKSRLSRKSRKSRKLLTTIINPNCEIPLLMPTSYLKNLILKLFTTYTEIKLSWIIPNVDFELSWIIPNVDFRFHKINSVNIHEFSSKKIARMIVYDSMIESIMKS